MVLQTYGSGLTWLSVAVISSSPCEWMVMSSETAFGRSVIGPLVNALSATGSHYKPKITLPSSEEGSAMCKSKHPPLPVGHCQALFAVDGP